VCAHIIRGVYPPRGSVNKSLVAHTAHADAGHAERRRHNSLLTAAEVRRSSARRQPSRRPVLARRLRLLLRPTPMHQAESTAFTSDVTGIWCAAAQNYMNIICLMYNDTK